MGAAESLLWKAEFRMGEAAVAELGVSRKKVRHPTSGTRRLQFQMSDLRVNRAEGRVPVYQGCDSGSRTVEPWCGPFPGFHAIKRGVHDATAPFSTVFESLLRELGWIPGKRDGEVLLQRGIGVGGTRGACARGRSVNCPPPLAHRRGQAGARRSRAGVDQRAFGPRSLFAIGRADDVPRLTPGPIVALHSRVPRAPRRSRRRKGTARLRHCPAD